MLNRNRSFHARLLGGAGALAIAAAAGSTAAQERSRITIEPQPLASALNAFGMQTGAPVISTPELTAAKMSAPVREAEDPGVALAQLLSGTGLSYRCSGDTYLIVPQARPAPTQTRCVAQDGAGGSAASEGAEVEALIVTAQKREEAIQDVPIAISAFSQKALEEQKIEGGYDLLKAIPNVTFSKSNFTSYNFSIRGVGTKAISATTDPGVAVAMNNTALIQNRLFEQEYFDVERVEVLRGPQGTLYGRNATSGVINVITAKPELGKYEGSLKGEIGNYNSRRLVGMLNVPLGDMLAVRIAGAGTQRSGYDFNEITGNNVNGRDLWGSRVTVGFEPIPALRANLVWEHFEEDDNRSRTSKQLCHRDDGPDEIGGEPTELTQYSAAFNKAYRGRFAQGCRAGSLYDDGAFDTPNGLALPFVFFAAVFGGDPGVGTAVTPIGYTATGRSAGIINLADPFGGLQQSRDLRTIASVRDPIYRAKADVLDLSIDFDLTESLSITSQTVYNKDEVYSFQDYNRFNSFPIFTDTSQLLPIQIGSFVRDYRMLAPGGVFCDPQIGCSDRLAGFDISQATGDQFSQELRLQSDFDGAINFSVGANYTQFETLVDYYVMYNLLTAIAMTFPLNDLRTASTSSPPTPLDFSTCFASDAFDPASSVGNGGPVPSDSPRAVCPYIDPNPVESINGEGHNYFRSKNPYKLNSKAVFGELYWNATEALKVTVGLRYTLDEKTFTPVPSQVLLAQGIVAGGTVNRGYPAKPDIVQEWGEWTGRLGVDWKPVLPFTDETMVYAFYSRGYKGGGANPPSPGFASIAETIAFLDFVNAPDVSYSWFTDEDAEPALYLTAVEYGPTFEPEFVDAFEVGSKNTLLAGAMTLNTTAFFYDYKDYQVSQIRDRTAVNENFDATIWGLELETVFTPSRNFRLNANLGYLDTKIADGETSVDIINRTQGNPDYVLVKPWIQLPSNCVVPLHVAVKEMQDRTPALLCDGQGGIFGSLRPDDPLLGGAYDPDNYPELNGGAGLSAQLGGNELPNAPHWTTNIGAQYGRDVLDGSWRVTLRGDAYWQSQSWARVYNAVNDKLHGWYNLNVSVRLANEDLGIEGEFYVKNLLDKSPITDAFLNSDDSGLTTNVFVLDPRLVGFNLRKTF